MPSTVAFVLQKELESIQNQLVDLNGQIRKHSVETPHPSRRTIQVLQSEFKRLQNRLAFVENQIDQLSRDDGPKLTRILRLSKLLGLAK